MLIFGQRKKETMTLQDTKNLKSEIRTMIDVKGFNFINASWLGELSEGASQTLSEYFFDAETLGKRDIASMLYHNQDSKLWGMIMSL